MRLALQAFCARSSRAQIEREGCGDLPADTDIERSSR